MKITGFDETSGSLLVSFASDTTKHQDPTEYSSFAYQPQTMWPDVVDPQKFPKLIATAGLWQTQQQEAKEKLDEDPSRINAIKAMVGQTYSYDVSDLVSLPNTNEILI